MYLLIQDLGQSVRPSVQPLELEEPIRIGGGLGDHYAFEVKELDGDSCDSAKQSAWVLHLVRVIVAGDVLNIS